MTLGIQEQGSRALESQRLGIRGEKTLQARTRTPEHALTVQVMQPTVNALNFTQITQPDQAKLRTVEAIASRLEAIATGNKKLLGAPGHTTRGKDATRGSWHRY